MTKTIYFAAPLFSEAEIAYNARCAKYLRGLGFNVILPQKEFAFSSYGELKQIIETLKGSNTSMNLKAIYNKCRSDVERADIVVAVLTGSEADSGTVVEATIGHMLGKEVYGLKEDSRSFSEGESVNVMVTGVCNGGIYDSFDELNEVLWGRRILH